MPKFFMRVGDTGIVNGDLFVGLFVNAIAPCFF